MVVPTSPLNLNFGNSFIIPMGTFKFGVLEKYLGVKIWEEAI